MKVSALIISCLFSILSYGQSASIMVYDLIEGTRDSITSFDRDPSILSEHTPHFIGCYNHSFAELNYTPPNTDVYPGTAFSYKKNASIDFELSDFPIRTSVKIFQIENDSLGHLCSGSLISSRHVLTAAHCISLYNTNNLRAFDSLMVSPIYHQGAFNSAFSSSYISKVYFFKNWTVGGDDIAILELEEPIGQETGWLGIGFAPDDHLNQEHIFYKFSYPSITNLFIDPNPYNGDTLTYNYGLVDYFTPGTIGVNGASGIQGESGSSLIQIKNTESYITYGVLSLSFNLTHSRITNQKYFAIKEIIQNDLNPAPINHNDFLVYPNPATTVIHIKGIDADGMLTLKLFDASGRLYVDLDEFESCLDLDISPFPPGIYYLRLSTSAFTVTKKIVKQGD